MDHLVPTPLQRAGTPSTRSGCYMVELSVWSLGSNMHVLKCR